MKNENSKIQIPNIDRDYTERAIDSLLSSLQADIILLNAGAGYGKTQALANYVRHFSGRSAWYSLSGTDNDLMSFIQNFTEAVCHAMGTPPKDFLVPAALSGNIDILMEQLVLWLDAQINFLNIILDDFQEITNPDIFNLLEILIETMDTKIRFFIVEKRSLPKFFDKYLQNGSAICLGLEELKFTPDEIAALLEATAENARQWADIIYDCTEGWPVGVAQIMSQINQHKTEATIGIIKEICDKLEVSDYFMTKVYKMLPFDIQTFLKKSAVLDYMTPSICNKITGIYNSESMLRYLVNENLFVQTLGEGSSLYRYHSIFQRFLLSQTTAEEQQSALRTAAYFLLKTNDKIQAAEYACRGEATDIILAVIEASGNSMLEEQLYGTMERCFAFLSTNRCELSAKARFIYGKYLMAQGREIEANKEIMLAGKTFYKEGSLQEYKKVLLFAAAAKRKAGELLQAQLYLEQAAEDSQLMQNELAQTYCAEQIKVKCCLHQLQEAAQLITSHGRQNVRFSENPFLAAAQSIAGIIKQTADLSSVLYTIRLGSIDDGFLLQNCLLAEKMRAAYLCADYQSVRQAAKEIIQISEYETLQTAVAWQLLAVLSWEEGNYRKAMEQSRMGEAFLQKNHIWSLELSPKHQQILKEIHSIHRNNADSHRLISSKGQAENTSPKESGKIRIRCLDCFLVFLPGSDGQELKWRTKKAKELFAYLFHLQGNSVSREALIALLWPDAGTKSAVALFHTTLYSIRQSFMQEGLEDLISYEKKKYSLNMQLVDSDLENLTLFLSDRQAWEKKPEQIMQLYPGSYMGSSGYLWSYGTAKELENKYLAVLESGAAMRIAQEAPKAAIPFLRRMLETDPYNEEIVTQLILCLYKSGKQSEAKQQYDRMQQLYREDLELDFGKSFKEIVAN